jgi:hypothetical protein
MFRLQEIIVRPFLEHENLKLQLWSAHGIAVLQVRCTIFFISFLTSSTCFGCYLHPSSGAQLQRTAIGFVWFGVFIPLEQVPVWDTLTL